MIPVIAFLLLGQGTTSVKSGPLTAEGYSLPPREISDAVLAPWYLNVTPGPISPDGSRFVYLQRDGMPPISLLGKAHINLGGLDIDISAQRVRNLTTRSAANVVIFELATRKTIVVPTPANARVSSPSWSPDGKLVAFQLVEEDQTRLAVADAQSGRYRTVGPKLLPTLSTSFEWFDRGRKLVSVFVPEGRKPLPTNPLIATGPRVQNSDTKTTSLVTYPSLLKTPFDVELAEYLVTGQLASVDVSNGETVPIGKPAMIDSFTADPGGMGLTVRTMLKPFSYLVPISRLGRRETLIDAKGTEIVELDKQEMDLSEDDPKPKPDARRGLAWRADGVGLSYIQNGTDPADKAKTEKDKKKKDRIFLWSAPFGPKDAKSFFESDTRINSVIYTNDPTGFFITQTIEGKERLSMVRVGRTMKTTTLLEQKADDDERASLVLRANGTARITPDGKSAWFSGTKTFKDPEKDAPRPFVDRIDLESAKRERIQESKPEFFETAALLDDEAANLLLRRESAKEVPQSYLFNRASKSETQLTDNKDYLPDITQARRETFTVTRPDGMKFQVKVTLPRFSYKNAAFFWFYPNEYVKQEDYDKTKKGFNKNLFPTISSQNKAILIRQGYAVVDNDCPIFGPKGLMNNQYIPQLRNNLSATIDELDRRDLIDRRKLAIGGHSYGAFSTLNALIHTPFFRAGIAGDGCYLRPLTPFGFQSEERKIWESREVYLTMSPLLYAEQMTGALLMYHGLEDQNVGTNPINSERMFTALESLGKTASLAMYPYEDHGQIAKETILDQWARFCAWLEKYLK